MTEATYTAIITPNGLDATLELMIRKSAPNGIDAPFSEAKTIAITDIDAELARMGYKRIEDFGEYCACGYAEAEVIR